jgi:hypothetical protein
VSVLSTSSRSDRGELDNIGSDDDRNGGTKPIQRVDFGNAELIRATWPPSSLNGMLQHIEERILIVSEVSWKSIRAAVAHYLDFALPDKTFCRDTAAR